MDMRRIILSVFIGLLVLAAGCQEQQITSFQECVEAGNPVMESYPRQCAANGQTFVEEVENPPLSPGQELGEQDLSQPVMHECTEEQKQNQVCTREYRPVCGLVDNGVRCVTEPCRSLDAKTFGNDCEACAGQAQSYYEGACEDQTFVVCQETRTGFSAQEFAENNGGICVDACPGNYDPFVTQIGVELCIPHYGEEEIAGWETCTESSASCDCVKAYETTRGDQIEGAQYRCVPSIYAERLLFRGGQDRLDENGEQSVMIA